MRSIVAALAVALLAATAPVQANSMTCGLKPLPPFGCSSGHAVCTCDADGNCGWVFVC